MPHVYTVSVENATLANADGDGDLLELDAAAEHPIELFGIQIFSLSEVQEAQEEWLRCQVIRGHTTTGGGTATTPRPVDDSDPAALFTAETDSATIASAGTAVNLMPFGINVRAGYEIFLPEACGHWTRSASLLVVRLMAGVTDDLTADLCFWVKEY